MMIYILVMAFCSIGTGCGQPARQFGHETFQTASACQARADEINRNLAVAIVGGTAICRRKHP